MSSAQPIIATETTFGAAGQTVAGYLARPTEITTAPALILIHEWWGLNNHIRDVAERFAREGMIAAAVDLFDGKFTTDAQEAAALMGNLKAPEALARIRTAFDALQAMPEVSNIGVVGFCLGGVYTLLTACELPVRAAVPFYGMPEDLSVLSDLQCPVLFIGGERDQWITVEKMSRLREVMKKHGKDGEVKIYPGADHAFFNDTRPEVYSAADAEDAWEHTLQFLRANLA